ncbi:hypothetical protein RlegWSM1455_27605 (plasmid) [Rhizobium laguerreae]|jgi:DNA polymerase III alpha subunit|uniref:DNA polymerase III alpha subunit n=1 Tax=Rhizobium laguerreae TaxID=1076926 RepID=A0AAX2QC23_9HYPH|nr:hypothetical protein [Rhizobium laguerreae]MBB3163833.1 DNA polymerase III alpha subunit [Rhizobium laguerreae]TCU13227.1 DNA polymerase III alpha subunit [Rhizobium laguerreae]UFW67102.1 hypothetical protein RlegWSM1455_27605 [Rhizobium laguerreae]
MLRPRWSNYVWQCVPERYLEGLPPDVLKVVRHELDLIRTMKYAPYFLTVFSTSAMRGHRAFLA